MRCLALRLLLLAVALASTEAAWATEPARFFVMGDGRLAVAHAHTGARADVRYRRPDGSYDAGALGTIRRAFRSAGDGGPGKASLRLIEVLSHLQHTTGVRPLSLVSGYRSPTYNEGLRQRGAKAAGGSLHTEGLAADVAFPRALLRDLWLELRRLECCGAGYYAKNGFLHVDVGRPRFWEPTTSRVDENLSAGNARIFARTEFDRYARGEPIVLTVHALTVPPLRLKATTTLVAASGPDVPVHLEAPGLAADDGCLELPATGTEVRVAGVESAARGHLVLSTCEPRIERTPPTVETNPLEVR